MNIKEARQKKHMSQKELAQRTGISESVLSRYENGTITPPSNKLQLIAAILNVTVDYLMGNNTNTFTVGRDSNGTFMTIHKQDALSDVNADKHFVYHNQNLHKLLVGIIGHCELCGNPAPFNTKSGEPYLEIHHIQWLSEGGLPIPENTVVLCPNCHCKIHELNDKGDIRKLQEAAKKH